MTERNYGHFGRPSLHIAIAAGVALLSHVLLPFGVVDYRGPAALDDDVLTLAQAREVRGFAPDSLQVANANPDLALAGIIIAGAGAALLLVMGYQPLRVSSARWIGHAGGLLAALGASMAFMPSMYATGTGFATFIGTVLGTEFRANFWAISPVLTAAASLYAIHQAFRVMTRVVADHDGLRDTVRGHLAAARWSLVLMGVVLLVPWSIGLLPDGVSDSVGTRLSVDNEAPLFFSAEDVQGATLAESAEGSRIRYGRDSDFGLLSATVHAFMALSWTTVAVGGLAAAAGTARSVGAGPGLEQGARYLLIASFLGMAVAAVLYLAAWIFFKPNSDPGGTFLPGFWTVLVPVPLWFQFRTQAHVWRGERVESGLLATPSSG